MTCQDHGSHQPDCVGCLGRWDRAAAQRVLVEHLLYGIAKTTIRGALAEIDRLEAERDALTIARNADRTEWMTTYATMRALLDEHTHDDLGEFADGDPAAHERAAAFRDHLARCPACEATLLGRLQENAVVSWAPQACTAAIACPREDCGAARGARCKTDRPVHLERWDAWKAAGFR